MGKDTPHKKHCAAKLEMASTSNNESDEHLSDSDLSVDGLAAGHFKTPPISDGSKSPQCMEPCGTMVGAVSVERQNSHDKLPTHIVFFQEVNPETWLSTSVDKWTFNAQAKQ